MSGPQKAMIIVLAAYVSCAYGADTTLPLYALPSRTSKIIAQLDPTHGITPTPARWLHVTDPQTHQDGWINKDTLQATSKTPWKIQETLRISHGRSHQEITRHEHLDSSTQQVLNQASKRIRLDQQKVANDIAQTLAAIERMHHDAWAVLGIQPEPPKRPSTPPTKAN